MITKNSVVKIQNLVANHEYDPLSRTLISETKLDDTFPVDQFVLEGFSKPFKIDRNKNGDGILLFVCEHIPARLISIEKAPIESFFTELNLRRKNWIVNYPHIWKSSDEIWIFIPLIMIILSFSGISMQMLVKKQRLTFVNFTI